MNSEVMGFVWLVVLLAANAFFVASEFAIMSARRSQIEPKADAGSQRAKTTLWAMEHVSLMLACAQLGITVCSLLILNVAEPSIKAVFEGPLEWMGIPGEVGYWIAFAIALLLVTFLHVTLGEMVPKNWAVTFADRAALLLAPPLVFISKIVKPIIVALNWLANHALRLVGIQPKDEVNSTFTLDEVQSIVAESQRHGLVDDESGVISGALEFSGHTADEVMVPLDQLITMPESATPAEVEAAVANYGFSRFPVKDADGELTGYVHLKDVMSVREDLADKPLRETQIRTLSNSRADEEIEDVLLDMQGKNTHMARVLDAKANTLGVIFLEDIVEELVGEIHDATQENGHEAHHTHG
ncbi:hemolysin family protein [Haematomicrobium sanguinis]|uniref:hemolysin family protein n=1 Tax=Haematomicrobium sanguinis TaxID=479106 RepID=UPI00047DDCEB|nr:hemolysin family protein [Haematomicrobium sanguinis]